MVFDLEGPSSSARVSPPERQQSQEPSYAEAARRREEQDYQSPKPGFVPRPSASHEDTQPGRLGSNRFTRGCRKGLREEFANDRPRRRVERQASYSPVPR